MAGARLSPRRALLAALPERAGKKAVSAHPGHEPSRKYTETAGWFREGAAHLPWRPLMTARAMKLRLHGPVRQPANLGASTSANVAAIPNQTRTITVLADEL